ncbi:MAG: peptidylprolyl isomerase [Oscillospiraceae bacterium]|nr:peptidylprolyl isomerase [Oscillospiraceae bacterium]
MNENEINQVPDEAIVQPEAEEVKKPVGDKRSPMEIAIAVVAVVLIVAVIAALLMGGVSGVTDPTEPDGSVAGTVPPDGNHDDVTCKGTYTVSDEQAAADAAKVVATMGDQALTNADLQIYYWMQVVSFLNEYGTYASALGMDYTKPLDTQMMDENWTWQQYFLDCGLDAWNAYESLAQEAIAAGFDKENEDYQTYIAALRDDITASAEAAGFASLEEMLVQYVGPGSTEEAYLDYMQTYYLGYLYFNALYEQMLPTDEEIETYFESNAADYEANGLTKDTGNYVDVRHILVMPNGGTTAEDGTTTYSEEEWEAARVEAQLILDNWLAGEATEETFADLAKVNTDDSNGDQGGLYTYVAEGDMVTEFNDWCFDESREIGDYGLVKTVYGYHVMYFSGSHPIWYVTAQADLETEIANGIIPAAMEKYETTVDYTSMVLGYVDLAAEQ